MRKKVHKNYAWNIYTIPALSNCTPNAWKSRENNYVDSEHFLPVNINICNSFNLKWGSSALPQSRAWLCMICGLEAGVGRSMSTVWPLKSAGCLLGNPPDTCHFHPPYTDPTIWVQSTWQVWAEGRNLWWIIVWCIEVSWKECPWLTANYGPPQRPAALFSGSYTGVPSKWTVIQH